MTVLRRLLLLMILLLAGPLLLATGGNAADSTLGWRDADRSSASLAPPAEQQAEALVQVYAARAFGWRGNFAVHTWLAYKAQGAREYTVHEVTGWGERALRSRQDVPDRLWYGNVPIVLAELRGEEATQAISHIEQAIADYPFADRYVAWPGPNSNTFTAWVMRQVPEFDVVLPNTAIGKDYLGTQVFAMTPGKGGIQLSLGGYVGVTAGLREGLELNLLGLSLGLDPLSLAIKLPGIGHLGWRDPWSL